MSPHTLLLRLDGPMQSWGYRSRFDYRDTALEPTRSGVIGLICAAMGIARGEDISRFNVIRMGVQVDEEEGRPERDFHTALNVVRADGGKGGTVVSRRDYLADAIFTVGLESTDVSLLEEIREALCNPEWTLFLGRKSFCLAEHPLSSFAAGDHSRNLEEALKGAAFSLRCAPTKREAEQKPFSSRFIIESPDGERTQHDYPLCFGERRFKPRSIQTFFKREGAGK